VVYLIISMKTFEEYLDESVASDELSSVLISLSKMVKKASSVIRTASSKKADSTNVFGEEQLELDIRVNGFVADVLKENPYVGLMASEELPDEEVVGEGEYGVCFDPLDGSSLVDVNLAVGSIFGVYKFEEDQKKSFIGLKGDDQLASMIAVYGPRTTIVLTVKDGVKEFLLCDNGEFVLITDDIKVDEGKMFAPGNLRACSKRDEYLELLNYWAKEQYTLRYSGGMVPDINQILLKGKGIFSYPGWQEAPNGKLRVLFECAPMALLMEQAGGSASNGEKRVLEIEVESIDQRCPIFIGSKGEVERCLQAL